MQGLGKVLRGSPADVGISMYLWDGKTLAAFIEQAYGVELELSVR
jgi:hypothetical protein